MDAQARNSIMPIKPEDWKKLGYSDSTIANDENEGLTNEIDPIFRYTHLSRAVPTWQTLTEAQYEELLVDIKPMLQLASLLIRSSPSLNADYDLYYSPRVHPKERVKSGSLPVLEYRHLDTTEPYWGERRDRANAALDRLAGVVDFRVVSEEENPEIEGVLAMTTSYFEVHPRGVNIQDDTDISKGAGSTIWINKMLLADLRRLRNEKGVDNTLKICSLWFKGAANLGHELFHAKFLATDSAFLADAMVEKGLRNYTAMRKFARKEGNAPNNEPLHEDDSDAELGYVWEKHIFGGHIQYTGYVNSCLFFSKWPSFWTSPTYHRRGGWRRKMTRYVVPMHYILNLQRQEFWDGMEDGNIETLLIKKWIGIREKCPQPKLVDPGWNTDDSSEGEYPLERPSLPRVCREKNGWVPSNESALRANESRQERLDRQLSERA